jgi:hypothetical protein
VYLIELVLLVIKLLAQLGIVAFEALHFVAPLLEYDILVVALALQLRVFCAQEVLNFI